MSHVHPHDHHHHHGPGHGHSHAPASPHPPMAVPFSFMRLGIAARLGIALLAAAALWCGVLLAMR